MIQDCKTAFKENIVKILEQKKIKIDIIYVLDNFVLHELMHKEQLSEIVSIFYVKARDKIIEFFKKNVNQEKNAAFYRTFMICCCMHEKFSVLSNKMNTDFFIKNINSLLQFEEKIYFWDLIKMDDANL